MAKLNPAPDKAEELRAATRIANETLKDMRQLAKELRELAELARERVNEDLSRYAKNEMDTARRDWARIMRQTELKIVARFSELEDILLGRQPAERSRAYRGLVDLAPPIAIEPLIEMLAELPADHPARAPALRKLQAVYFALKAGNGGVASEDLPQEAYPIRTEFFDSLTGFIVHVETAREPGAIVVPPLLDRVSEGATVGVRIIRADGVVTEYAPDHGAVQYANRQPRASG